MTWQYLKWESYAELEPFEVMVNVSLLLDLQAACNIGILDRLRCLQFGDPVYMAQWKIALPSSYLVDAAKGLECIW